MRNFVVTFFGVRDFLGIDKKRNPGFSFLCQAIVSVSFTYVNYMEIRQGDFLFKPFIHKRSPPRSR